MSPSKATTSSSLTQEQLMQMKKAEQRAKTRDHMARYRAQLKDLPVEEQQAAKERDRIAQARYRDNHRLELRAHAIRARASEYVAKYGVEAYEAKLERKRNKILLDEGKRRRAVRPRAPRRSPKKSQCPIRSGDGDELDELSA